MWMGMGMGSAFRCMRACSCAGRRMRILPKLDVLPKHRFLPPTFVLVIK